MAERDHDGPADDDPDAPASAEEIAASQRLRDALAGLPPGAPSDADEPEIALALALRAAWDPSLLSEDENRAVLDVTPDAIEQAAAVRLRDALATRSAGATEPGTLALALQAAFAPRAIDPDEHRRILDAALGALPARKVVPLRRATGRIVFGAGAGALALAAAVFLLVTAAPPRAEAPLVRVRTTQPLFSEPFRAGDGSARIDRIASARAMDFRDNRFSTWGVR